MSLAEHRFVDVLAAGVERRRHHGDADGRPLPRARAAAGRVGRERVRHAAVGGLLRVDTRHQQVERGDARPVHRPLRRGVLPDKG